MGWFSFISRHLGAATVFSALFMGSELIKEKTRPTIPASYWRNNELMNADKLNPNISPQQVQKNLESGKYYLSDAEYERRQKAEKPDYSYREGEDINSWMERLSRESKERMDKLYGRK